MGRPLGSVSGWLLVLCVASSTAGCGEVVRQVESMQQSSTAKTLTVGMSRDDLISLMGQPKKRENYGRTEFLIYETNYLAFTDSGRFTPIAVVNGKVIGWGHEYYGAVVKAQSTWDSKVN
ncbi:MAG: hypothetical protein ACR2PO_06090 [Methyloligellaceae bacterium]